MRAIFRFMAKKPLTNALVAQEARHYMRFLRAEQGEKPEEIAHSEGISLSAVQRSIQRIRLHRALNTQENLNHAVVGMMTQNMMHAGNAFKRMLNAKNYVEHKRADGSTKVLTVDNPDVQLRALNTFQKYVEAVQPQRSGPKLTIQQNNANQSTATANVRSGGYEQMLNEILHNARSHNQLPRQVVDVPDIEEEPGDDGDEDDGE